MSPGVNFSRGRRHARPSLAEYVIAGLWMAAATCVVAVIGVGVGLFRMSVSASDVPQPTPLELAIALLGIFASYFVMGIAGAIILWLLHPVRESLVGWMLRGAVLAPILYGTVGLASIFLYQYAGVNLMGYESLEEAWFFFKWSIPVFAFMGAVLGGPIIYYQERRGRSGT